MTCTEYRDLFELDRDGALDAATAAAVRSHREGCADCRAFDADGEVLLAPFAGFPPGPYLPPAGRGPLPPFASGPALLGFLLLLLGGAAASWALRGGDRVPAMRGTAPETTTDSVPGPAVASAPSDPLPPAAIHDPARGLSLHGRVVTFPGRRPVPGVRLLLDGVPSATTDRFGVFRVRDLAVAGHRRLRLEPPSGPAVEFLLPWLAAGQEHLLADLPLGPPASARIRVVRSDARPGAGVVVRAWPLAPSLFPDGSPEWKAAKEGGRLPPGPSVSAGPDGVAPFLDLHPGRWTFQAEVDGRPFSPPADLDIRDDPGAGATLFLEPTVPFEGRVLDDATGHPVPGAVVRWWRVGSRMGSEDLRFHGSAVAGADGTFLLPSVPGVPLLLKAAASGIPVPVDAGRVDRADLRLPSAAALAGLCVEAGTGRPAAGVEVRVQGAAVPGGYLFARTGEDGGFEFPGLPGQTLFAVAPHPRTAWWLPDGAAEALLLPGTPCRLEVERSGSIRGVVRGGAGRPVVACGYRRGGDGFGTGVLLSHDYADGEGRFRLSHLPPGRVVLFSPEPTDISSQAMLAEARDALDAPEPGQAVVEVPSGGEATAAILPRLADPTTSGTPLGDPGARLRGTLLDGSGAPVKGALLHLMAGDLGPMLRIPDAIHLFPRGRPVPVAPDGSFAADLLPGELEAGRPVTLTAFSPRHPPAFSVAGAADGPVEVRFAEGAAIAGRLLHADGSPAAGVLLEALPQQDARVNLGSILVRGRTGEDGAFRIDGLHPVPHTLSVGWAPGPRHRFAGVLPGGEPAEYRLPPGDGERPAPPSAPEPKAPPDPSATAILEGAAPPGVRVHAFDPVSGWAAPEPVLSDGNGRFRVRIPPGLSVSLAFEESPGRWRYRDAAGPARTLRGRVVTPAGTAAAGVPVHAVCLSAKGTWTFAGAWRGAPGPDTFPVPRFLRTTLTAEDGGFDLGSPPGRWAVFAGRLGADDLAPGPAEIWTSADPRILEVPLVPGKVLTVEPGEGGANPFFAEVRLDGFLPAPGGPVVAARVRQDGDGRFRLRGLPPGPVTVVLLDADRREVGRGPAEPGDPRDPPAKIAVIR